MNPFSSHQKYKNDQPQFQITIDVVTLQKSCSLQQEAREGNQTRKVGTSPINTPQFMLQKKFDMAEGIMELDEIQGQGGIGSNNNSLKHSMYNTLANRKSMNSIT